MAERPSPCCCAFSGPTRGCARRQALVIRDFMFSKAARLGDRRDEPRRHSLEGRWAARRGRHPSRGDARSSGGVLLPPSTACFLFRKRTLPRRRFPRAPAHGPPRHGPVGRPAAAEADCRSPPFVGTDESSASSHLDSETESKNGGFLWELAHHTSISAGPRPRPIHLSGVTFLHLTLCERGARRRPGWLSGMRPSPGPPTHLFFATSSRGPSLWRHLRHRSSPPDALRPSPATVLIAPVWPAFSTPHRGVLPNWARSSA
jgi:hypothetical protein